jgi:hypothetical protein
VEEYLGGGVLGGGVRSIGRRVKKVLHSINKPRHLLSLLRSLLVTVDFPLFRPRLFVRRVACSFALAPLSPLRFCAFPAQACGLSECVYNVI